MKFSGHMTMYQKINLWKTEGNYILIGHSEVEFKHFQSSFFWKWIGILYKPWVIQPYEAVRLIELYKCVPTERGGCAMALGLALFIVYFVQLHLLQEQKLLSKWFLIRSKFLHMKFSGHVTMYQRLSPNYILIA